VITVSLKESLTKSTLANIAAFIIVVSGLGYAIYTKNTELVKSLLLFGLGYLFGRQAKR